MISLQRQMDSAITLRLVHDLSPDSEENYTDEDEESLAVQRESFLISCLAQAAINNNNSISHLSQTTCDRFCHKTENITESFTRFEWKQHQFERINNHINEQHLYKTLEEPIANINLVNNNYLQSPEVDCDSSDKENVRPASPPSCRGTVSTFKSSRRPRKLPDIPKLNVQATSVPLRPKVELQQPMSCGRIATSTLKEGAKS
ncbi:hypothetical protein DPMN_051355 [Dreissena polymorpha]|uniref:Uncharacterized protein n=1 Tax=Dreissena polymorpha TaxID=45954 RepID=A0A9D4CJT3_DREPO|nr:hypothetical protein DPMN_051355 [Dreissena polymorpha]